MLYLDPSSYNNSYKKYYFYLTLLNVEKSTPFIPINKPWIGDDEKKEILSVLEEESFTSPAYGGGKRVRIFEDLLKDYLKCKHVIAVNSGTAALHAALLSLDIKPGDEVLLPSFTFVATANAVVAVGAVPIFVDIDIGSYTIDVTDLKRKITPKSRAIIPVHLYGHVANIEEVLDVAGEDSLFVVEDACQSLGSQLRKKQTGTFGNLGCFSLYASKVVTSGEGGAIVTDDDSLADKLKMIRNHGMVKGYDTQAFGLNLRLPELSAALAISQIKKLSLILEKRRRNANHLNDLLKEIKKEKEKEKEQKESKMNVNECELVLPIEGEGTEYNWYLYTIRFSHKNFIQIREVVRNELVKSGIGATVYYDPPVHQTPYYDKMSRINKNANSIDLPNTELASKSVLSLPVHPLVTEKEIEYISGILKNAIEKF